MTVATTDEQESGGVPNDETVTVADAEPTRAEKRAAREQSARTEPRFSLERLLGPDGPTIAGHDAPTIAGALHDEDATTDFTRAQIEKKVSAFLERPVQEG